MDSDSDSGHSRSQLCICSRWSRWRLHIYLLIRTLAIYLILLSIHKQSARDPFLGHRTFLTEQSLLQISVPSWEFLAPGIFHQDYYCASAGSIVRGALASIVCGFLYYWQEARSRFPSSNTARPPPHGPEWVDGLLLSLFSVLPAPLLSTYFTGPLITVAQGVACFIKKQMDPPARICWG